MITFKAFGLALLCLASGALHAQVNALPQARHILVYGDAQARAIPDRFKIEITFNTVDPSVDVARRQVEDHLQDALAKLRQASVPDNEIIATSLQIAPQNEYDPESRKQVFKGIGVTRTLSARFSDQTGLKAFLSKLATSQEVQVSGVTTELSAEPELRKQLRQKAIESTREKADVIAKSYGVKVVGLYSVSDSAPQFAYGITEGSWPGLYQWNRSQSSLDRISLAGGSLEAAAPVTRESFQTGYVEYDDKIYAVFLIAD